jgi:tryptophan synthase alpha chain
MTTSTAHSLTITQGFQALRERQHCALIPFITAGDPDLATTAAALQILDRNGADFIELGIPYSDPLADGPVIQAAATRALQRGTRLESVLRMLRSVGPRLKAPIILFTYYNPILNCGVATFLQQIAEVGVKGLVVPDLPIEEAAELLRLATNLGIEVILLVAPNSSKERVAAIAQQSQGFIYLVSVTGVTGTRSGIESRVEGLLQNLRETTDKPIGVGFGISNPDQARQVRAWGADAVIVGSAFVQHLASDSPTEGLQAIATLCRDLKAAVLPTHADSYPVIGAKSLSKT